MFETTPGYTFVDEDSCRVFIEEVQKELYLTFYQDICEPVFVSPDIEKCVKGLVFKMQKLDFIATGITVIRHFLGESSYEKYNLSRLLEFGEGDSCVCVGEIFNSLKRVLEDNAKIEDRLPDASISFIIDMAAGLVNPDEAGWLRLQEIINVL
jgi:hypothetical protein